MLWEDQIVADGENTGKGSLRQGRLPRGCHSRAREKPGGGPRVFGGGNSNPVRSQTPDFWTPKGQKWQV